MKTTHILLLIIYFTITQSNAQSDSCLNNVTLGMSFPPVSSSEQRDFSKLHLNNLGITKIRFAEDWAFREPTQGVFNWAPLDERIKWALENNYEIMLTIQSNAPAWACTAVKNQRSCVFSDNSAFKLYIDSLLNKYAGQINKIQFGNEWQSDTWYVGSALDFITANNILYNSVQTYSPSTQVVLGGFTTVSLKYLALCNGAVQSFLNDDGVSVTASVCSNALIQNVKNRIDSVLTYALYNTIDLHLYDDVEQWDEYYLNFIDTIATPIIVSEFGGPNLNYEPYTPTYQSTQLYTYIKQLDSLHIQEAYYFKLVEGTDNPTHAASGLIADTTLQIKPAYNTFKTMNTCTPTGYKNDYVSEFNIYPNPSTSTINIQFLAPPLTKQIVEIYNAFGSLVQTVHGYASATDIDVSALPAGIYTIQCTDRALGSVRFIKM